MHCSLVQHMALVAASLHKCGLNGFWNSWQTASKKCCDLPDPSILRFQLFLLLHQLPRNQNAQAVLLTPAVMTNVTHEARNADSQKISHLLGNAQRAFSTGQVLTQVICTMTPASGHSPHNVAETRQELQLLAHRKRTVLLQHPLLRSRLHHHLFHHHRFHHHSNHNHHYDHHVNNNVSIETSTSA